MMFVCCCAKVHVLQILIVIINTQVRLHVQVVNCMLFMIHYVYPMVYVVNGRQHSALHVHPTVKLIANMAMESDHKVMLGVLHYSKASAYHPPLPHACHGG